jgi:hypothetical protein
MVKLLEEMRAAALAADRDPEAIEVTAGGVAAFAEDPEAAVREWEDAGVHRLVIPPLSYDVSDIDRALGEFGERVISRLA